MQNEFIIKRNPDCQAAGSPFNHFSLSFTYHWIPSGCRQPFQTFFILVHFPIRSPPCRIAKMYSPVLLSVLCLLATGSSAAPIESRAPFNRIASRQALGSQNTTIYPQKAASDPIYSVDEATLKAAIKLPKGFTAGKKMPVILVPGTGTTGTESFSSNFMKNLADDPMVEPVALDIPHNLLDDVQINAEFVAYSINSVSMMAGNKNVSVVTWSQGSIDMQWAVKYWTSTRAIVSDFVAISPDINGTTVASTLEPVQGAVSIPPSLHQQESDSMLIATLRANGGDSAFVPTTTIYSSFDQVVIPQVGDTASGYFKQDNGIPAANYQLQVVCGNNSAAGGNFTHEGVVYNSFTYAIALDAFSNPGPGDAKRLDLQKVCSAPLAPGLTAKDKAAMDGLGSTVQKNVLVYLATGNTSSTEVPIRAYAVKDQPKTDPATGGGAIISGLGSLF